MGGRVLTNRKLTIYLDQNKWIQLAKTVLGKPDTSQYEDVKDLILEKVAKNDWQVPLSIIHHLETMSRLEDRSRTELAKVMGKVSPNYSVLPFMYIDKAEFRNSLRKVLNLSTIDFRDEVISKDFLRSCGLVGTNPIISGISDSQSAELFKKTVLSFMNSTNLFYEWMKMEPDIDFVTSLRADNTFFVSELEKFRDHFRTVPKKDRYVAFLIRYYLDCFTEELKRFISEMKSMNVPKEKMLPEEIFASRETTSSFLESIPSFLVRVRLIYEVINAEGRRIDKNDYKDIAFLATAVPYCDVVITERFWAHLIKKNKLDSKFNTIVTSDLNYLTNFR